MAQPRGRHPLLQGEANKAEQEAPLLLPQRQSPKLFYSCAGLRLDAFRAGRRHHGETAGAAVAAAVPARASIDEQMAGQPLRSSLAAMTCGPHCPHPTGRPLTRMDTLCRVSGGPAGVTCSMQQAGTCSRQGSKLIIHALARRFQHERPQQVVVSAYRAALSELSLAAGAPN